MKSLSRRLKNLEDTMQAAELDEPMPPEDDVLGRLLWAYPRVMAHQAQQHPISAYSGPDARNPYRVFIEAVHRLSPEDLARLSFSE